MGAGRFVLCCQILLYGLLYSEAFGLVERRLLQLCMMQGGSNAEDADVSEVEEEDASGSDEEEVSSESGASEFEDKDKAKRRTGKMSDSTCFHAAYLTSLS